MISIDDPYIHDEVYACHDDGDVGDDVHGDVYNDFHADVEEHIHDGVDVADDVDSDDAVDDFAGDAVGDDGHANVDVGAVDDNVDDVDFFSVSINFRIDKTMYIWRRVEAWWVSGWLGN